MNEAIKMQLSAFVDGELPENEKELLIRRLSQDAGLRQLVAEYMSIGRAMRGETQLGNVNELRNRVANALGDKPLQDEQVDVEASKDRLIRPLAGVAIAATVALVGILGLQQVSEVNAPEVAPNDVVVDASDLPTQPDADDLLRQYGLMHDALASDHGANSIKTRLTALEFLEKNATETEAQEATEADDTAAQENDRDD